MTRREVVHILKRLFRSARRRRSGGVHLRRHARERAEYLFHRESARAYVRLLLYRANARYGFSYNRVSIKDQRTRWGSCSEKGNLNFHYRILALPPHLAEYVVAHELCHLAELNHSPRFWDLLAQTIPHYKEARKELRAIRPRALHIGKTPRQNEVATQKAKISENHLTKIAQLKRKLFVAKTRETTFREMGSGMI